MAHAGEQFPNATAPVSDRRLKYLDREMARHSYKESGLLEILFKANGLFGYLPDDILRYIARSLNVAPSRVFATATFYSRFSFTPETEEVVRVCNGLSCRMNGATTLARDLFGPQQSAHVAHCSGLCGHGPVVHVGKKVLVHATVASVHAAREEMEGRPHDAG